MNATLTGIAAAAPAIAMLAMFACLIGGIALVVRPHGDTRKGVLMLVMAVVLLANVAIWTL